MKERANIKECVNRLHERIREIETKFNIRLSEEDKDLFNDLKRDILIPLDASSTKGVINSQEGEVRTKANEFHPTTDISGTGGHSISQSNDSPTPDISLLGTSSPKSQTQENKGLLLCKNCGLDEDEHYGEWCPSRNSKFVPQDILTNKEGNVNKENNAYENVNKKGCGKDIKGLTMSPPCGTLDDYDNVMLCDNCSKQDKSESSDVHSSIKKEIDKDYVKTNKEVKE